MAIAPSKEQIQALAANAPEGELFMLNLLKFKERAEYADGRETDLTGAEAYGLYAEGVGRIIRDLGGRSIWGGATNVLVIGNEPLAWDMVAIVAYPSFEAFRTMTASADYQAVHVHREAGLAHQVLINCVSLDQARTLAGAS
jgi:uncharacterized protein (DUF1330 family)